MHFPKRHGSLPVLSVLAVGVCLALVVPAVRAGAAGNPIDAPLLTPLTRSDSVPGTEHYEDVGVRLEPLTAPTQASTSIDAVSARAVLEKGVPVPDPSLLSGPVNVRLMDYSNDVAGISNADGSVTPERQHLLSWVVTYPLLAAPTPHGPARGTTWSKPTTLLNCRYVGIVDARGGDWLQTVSTCADPVVPVK